MGLRRISSGRCIAALAGLLSLLAVAGCEHPTSETTDYRVQHKIAVEEHVFAMDVNLSSDDAAFEAPAEDRIRSFAREYVRRGRGPFLITGAGMHRAVMRHALDRIAAVLVSEGVRPERVHLQTRRGDDKASTTTHLSFSGFVARPPECGDWSGETGFAPSNQPHSDFGCSVQRNVGLMLSNPGDLKQSRENAYGDAQRTDSLVRAQRAPKTTFGRGAPTLEQKDFSDVK